MTNEYREKRDFEQMPEPAGGERPRRLDKHPAFVVHRHEATQLHYDLRLESQGALKSWAVPKGFSYVPTKKHLAVLTEDHPLEYEHFEGVIPKGQYGAGTMTIWDHGHYELLNAPDASAGVASGKLELRLFGKRLRGEWHLVKTREKDEWLLFKKKDGYAREAGDPPYPFAIDLDQARRAGFPRKPVPTQARESSAPFSNPAWLFELEFRGMRVFAEKKTRSVALKRAGFGEKLTEQPKELTDALAALRADRALLDGVLVALDEYQRPCRETLERRLEGKNDAPVSLCVFDLLYYDEWHLGGLPLLERKRLLEAVLPPNGSVVYVDHVLGEGEKLCAVVAEAGLSAVIAKKTSSTYGDDPTSWRRIEIESKGQTHPKGDLVQFLKGSAKKSSRYGRVRFTNRNKVFWPELGFSKGDLIDYYEQVAEHLLPYPYERPLHMHRFPDGVDGKSFYHKNAPSHVPEWITTESIPTGAEKKPIRYIICNDRETLLYLANLGSIDLHPWLSRRANLDNPDWLILDLDPDGSPFPQVTRVARAIGKLLRGIGLRPSVKTSGASGIHIVVPVEPRYTYEQVRAFAEGLARYTAREHPDVATVQRSIPHRRGRVYVDFLQNRRGQTVVPPYVVRPVEPRRYRRRSTGTSSVRSSRRNS